MFEQLAKFKRLLLVTGCFLEVLHVPGRCVGLSPMAVSQVSQDREIARRALQERFGSLSRREREVMSLIVKDMMNKQVGGALEISEITVKAHRGKVMQKMQARSFADLVNMASELGIVTGHVV